MSDTPVDAATPAVSGLPRRARTVRLVATAVVLALLTTGTLVGQDHDFPFGPFRMYATRDDPNAAVIQAVVLARTVDGVTHDVTDTSAAPRRAELEGRLSVFAAHPDQFTAFAAVYARDGGVADVATVTLVQREYRLRDGRQAGTVDVPLATWTAR